MYLFLLKLRVISLCFNVCICFFWFLVVLELSASTICSSTAFFSSMDILVFFSIRLVILMLMFLYDCIFLFVIFFMKFFVCLSMVEIFLNMMRSLSGFIFFVVLFILVLFITFSMVNFNIVVVEFLVGMMSYLFWSVLNFGFCNMWNCNLVWLFFCTTFSVVDFSMAWKRSYFTKICLRCNCLIFLDVLCLIVLYFWMYLVCMRCGMNFGMFL